MKTLLFILLCLLISLAAGAQSVTSPTTPVITQTNSAPTPSQSNVTFNVGASAFGAGGTNATPASDVTLELNPRFATTGYLSEVSLLSDNALAPGINWQYYGGGFNAPIPVKLSASSVLAPLSFYWRATAGSERIVPTNGPSQSHVGAMLGGGANWETSVGVEVRLFEAGVIISPNAAWGNKAPYFAGGISYLFGH